MNNVIIFIAFCIFTENRSTYFCAVEQQRILFLAKKFGGV